MGISLKAWGEYAHRKMAIHLRWLGGERLIIGYENNLISTSLGCPLSYLNLQTPMKICGFGDRGSPHPRKGGLGGLKHANHSLGCL